MSPLLQRDTRSARATATVSETRQPTARTVFASVNGHAQAVVVRAAVGSEPARRTSIGRQR